MVDDGSKPGTKLAPPRQSGMTNNPRPGRQQVSGHDHSTVKHLDQGGELRVARLDEIGDAAVAGFGVDAFNQALL